MLAVRTGTADAWGMEPRSTDRTRALFGLALAVSAVSIAAAHPAPLGAVEPVASQVAPEPAAVGAGIRALERRTERSAARLGLTATRRGPLPVALPRLVSRERALENVAAFLDARHEVLRSRVRGPAAARPRGASTRADVVRSSARLGLNRLAAARRTGNAAETRRRWRDVARWLSARREVLRDIEQPLMRPVPGTQTSPFGSRGGRLHEGVDIGGPIGTPIRAAASGVVVSAGWNAGYGRIVVIRHPGGLSTAYAHMSAVTVARGRPVAQGDVVGRRGSTGHSTGPHLHFETRVHGQAVDPAPYLRHAAAARGGA